MPHPEGVLEIYMMGGMNPWDTFYSVPDYGKPDDDVYPNQQWWTFQEGEESVSSVFDGCGGGSQELLLPFGTDSNNRTVNLGPWTYPLRERPDILARMRIHSMQHLFEPHQVATPLMLCGHPRGTPRMSATPSHIQRYFSGLEPDRTTPFSYVLFSEDTETQDEFNIQTAVASGLHPASARPLSIRLLADNPLPTQLSRAHLGGYHTQTDALVSRYLEQYQSMLRYPATGTSIPSSTLSDLYTARRNLQNSGRLGQILTSELLAPVSGSECGHDAAMDTPRMGMRLASDLLTRANDRAKWVTYVDSGMINAESAGYDTHDHHVVESSRNIIHTCRTLSEIVNKPGENDPKKLDLDKHMILITTEFGRTPYEEKRRMLGLNHWPFGFAVVQIGGPVDAARSGVVGGIGPGGYADRASTPAEFRAAMLMAMGIWPFSNQGFAVGDVRGANSEHVAAAMVRDWVLGYPI
ncbi:MAG: hypothetical protein ACI9WU_001853 [Myxococcota bacterium]|jgi:hypothetical protein